MAMGDAKPLVTLLISMPSRNRDLGESGCAIHFQLNLLSSQGRLNRLAFIAL
jgi:hypothetical protein